MRKKLKIKRMVSLLLVLSILSSLVFQVFTSIAYAAEGTNYQAEKTESSEEILIEEEGAQEFIFDQESKTITGYKDGNAPENLVIPASINGVDVKHIGKDAFLYSTSSSTAKINSSLKALTLPEGLKTIDYRAFQGNELTEVIIPSTLEVLGQRAFGLNKTLTTVVLGDDSKLKEIGEEALYDCSIENIKLPDSLVEIGTRALAGNKITSIEVPNSVTKIGSSAFQLNLIEEFVVPNNIEILNGGKDSGGLFFRNFNNTDKSSSSLRLTKIYDNNGKATVLNTRGIVNSVSVNIKYINAGTNEEIKPADSVVGKEYKKIVTVKHPTYGWDVTELGDGQGDYIFNYMAPSQSTDLYSKYFADISSNYFSKGDKITLTPGKIPGYTAPIEKSIVLNENVNEVVFQYEQLGNVNLVLQGEGLTSSVAEGEVPLNETVTLTINPPVNKEIKSFKINEIERISDLRSTEISSNYTFDITEDTLVKVEYKDVSYFEEFKIIIDKPDLKLGEKANIKAFYRDKSIELPSDEINWTIDNGDLAVLDLNSGVVASLKSGSVVIKGALKNNPEISDTVRLNINPLKVKVRIEADFKTILEPVEVEITDLDLSKYKITTKYKEPKAIHGIIKALDVNKEETGINPAYKDDFEIDSGGYYISRIAEYDGFFLNGWIYHVDNQYVGTGVSDRSISNGEYITLYYTDNFIDNIYVYFKTDKHEIKSGEELLLQFGANATDMWTGQPKEADLENIIILNDRIPLEKEDGSYYKTDAEGKVRIKLDTPGEYHISAKKVNDDGEMILSRPYALVKVIESEEEIKDTIAPVISLGGVEKQQTIKNGTDFIVPELTATDNIDEAVEVTFVLRDGAGNIINSIDTTLAGVYTISYQAVDKAGNEANEVVVTIIVEELKEQEENKIIASTKEQLEKNLSYILNNFNNPTFGGIEGDWSILALARAGYQVPDDYYDLYFNKVVGEVETQMERYSGKLHRSKSSEHARLILSLTSIGRDVTNVSGHNILEALTDYNYIIRQGINGPIFALIALDSRDYDIPDVKEVATKTTKTILIDYILDREIEGGGWSLGNVADPDITAMAIQALTPHYQSNKYIKEAIDRAINWLSSVQTSDGGYASWSNDNIESVAQVVVALSGLGIDSHTDDRFVKNGNSLIDALMSYAVLDGGFRHIQNGTIDRMATEQGTYALVAYERFINSQNRLYDMTDVAINDVSDEVIAEKEETIIKNNDVDDNGEGLGKVKDNDNGDITDDSLINKENVNSDDVNIENDDKLTKNTESPKTGDNSPLLQLLSMVALSTIVLIVLVVNTIRRFKKEA